MNLRINLMFLLALLNISHFTQKLQNFDKKVRKLSRQVTIKNKKLENIDYQAFSLVRKSFRDFFYF
jgi:hypothetical protein